MLNHAMKILPNRSFCQIFNSSKYSYGAKNFNHISIAEIIQISKKMEKSKLTKVDDKNKYVLKTAKGTRDRNPVQMAILESVFDTIKECFKRHDAVTIETPVFELKELLTGKYGEDTKLIYDLQDQGGELLSLRYDLTVPFARYVAMNKIKNIKRYQIGKVYRRDQPAMTRGRFREFYQCDFDIAGDYGLMMADVECIRIIYEVLSELNLGKFVIKVNHRRILDGLFQACGVPADKFTSTCSTVDKLDKSPWTEVRRELCEEKGLSSETADRIGTYVQLSGDATLIDRLLADSSLDIASRPAFGEALEEIRLLLQYAQAMGISSDCLVFDLSLARGLDYYTGVIYEAILKGFEYDPTKQTSADPIECQGDKQTAATASAKSKNKNNKKKSKGATVAADEDADLEAEGGCSAVGSVAGGGRYDGLVGMFDGSASGRVPCVGLSFGVERLLAIREALARQEAGLDSVPQPNSSGVGRALRSTQTEVMVCAAHKGLAVPRMEFCRRLWDAKIKATYSQKANPKLLDQLQYCESTGIPVAIILGDGELARNVVKLRIVSTRHEQEVSVDELTATLKIELARLSGQQ